MKNVLLAAIVFALIFSSNNFSQKKETNKMSDSKTIAVIKTNMGTIEIELFAKENPTLKFSVEVKYQDVEEQNYSHIFNINIEMLKGLSLDIAETDRIERSLEQIQRETEKLSRSVERFVQYQYEKDIKEKQQKKRSTKAS